MTRTGRLLFAAVLAAAAAPAWAGPGVAGGDVFKVPVEARGWGMGSAYSAVADDVGAMAYNPAGLSLAGDREVRYTQYFGFQSSLFGSMLGAWPTGRWGALGVMWVYHTVREIENTGDQFFPLQGVTEPVSVWDQVIGGYIATRFSHLFPGTRLLAPFAVGLGIKSLTAQVASFSASTVALDLGLLAVYDQVRLALVGQHLGGGYGFAGGVEQEANPLPMTLRTSVAYVPYEDASSSLTVALENASYIGIASRQRQPDDTRRRVTEGLNLVGVGAEFWRLKKMGVRLGYAAPWGTGASAFQAGKGLTVGGSFRIFTDYASYQFDLAWRPLRIGNSPQDAVEISLGLRF